jgi:nucleoside-diphosphate-sugar epimerase
LLKTKPDAKDILDFETLIKEFRDVDYVFHNAAVRSIPLSIKEPVMTSRTNILGTLNVLEAARKENVKRVILASSSSVYGSNSPPLDESMQTEPLSLYAGAKVANENHARLYHELYGLETICLRYFNAFGYGQDGVYEYSPVIPKFIHAILNGERPVIFGNGEHSRDFTFIDNIVEANVLAMNAGKSALGKPFNVGQGEETSLNSLLAEINSILGKEVKAVYKEERKGDVKHTHADLSNSSEILGYSPKYSFKDGLKETIGWYVDFIKK